MSNVSRQQLGAWLVEIALIQRRDHTPYSYYGDTAKPDPLFETAARWRLDVEAIKAANTENPKPLRKRKDQRRSRAASPLYSVRNAFLCIAKSSSPLFM